MDVEQISKILEEVAKEFTEGSIDRDFFSQFIIYNDLGIPLAQSLVYNLSTPTLEGERLILETWNNFCELLDIDPEDEYEDLDEIFEIYGEEEDG